MKDLNSSQAFATVVAALFPGALSVWAVVEEKSESTEEEEEKERDFVMEKDREFHAGEAIRVTLRETIK